MQIVFLKRWLLLITTAIFPVQLYCQLNCGRTVLLGHRGTIAVFGDTALLPTVRTTFSSINNNIIFYRGFSSISSSISGLPVLCTNNVNIYDTLGNVIQNGDRITDSLCFIALGSGTPQQSIFLPLENNRYVCIVGNITDSAYTTCWLNAQCGPLQQHFDELRYNLIDMNANNGLGSVIVKNRKMIAKTPMTISLLQACKHANGKDWWVLKPGVDSFTVYRFLITSDSIYGPYAQLWNNAQEYWVNGWGQMNFSPDGSKYASVFGYGKSKLVTGDFDRCTGLLSNEKIYNIPIDSMNSWPDTASMGVCYSPNSRFVYVSKWKNIYQLDLDEQDSNLAWYRVKAGCDSLIPPNSSCSSPYFTLFNGPDRRIYTSHFAQSTNNAGFSVILNPNNKGANCGWCNYCMHTPTYLSLGAFANQPNYSLGTTNNPNCWPVGVPAAPLIPDDEWLIYPNPATNEISIDYACNGAGKFMLYNSLGQEVFSTNLLANTNHHRLQLPETLNTGLYHYRCSFSSACEDKIGKISISK